MVLMEYLKWDLLVVSLFLLTFYYTYRAHAKNQILSKCFSEQAKITKALQDDVKVLYESASNLGVSLKKLEHGSKVLKEQQEQLTLKEPNQQAYRNAIQAIQNGETINKVSETSGLSRGEVELLKMFQKFDVNTSEKKQEVVD